MTSRNYFLAHCSATLQPASIPHVLVWRVWRPKTSPASFTPAVMTSEVPLFSSCSDKMFPAFGFGAQIPPDYKVTVLLAVSQHAPSCLPPLLPPCHVRVLLGKHTSRHLHEETGEKVLHSGQTVQVLVLFISALSH